MTDYVLPDPKKETDWVKCIVLSFKTLKGVDYADRAWDRVHWGRAAKSAKALLEICGTVRAADACMVELSSGFEQKELSWTLETILKHAHDWITKKRGASHGNSYRAGFFKALAERGRSPNSPELRQAEGPLLDSFGSLQDTEKEHSENGQ